MTNRQPIREIRAAAFVAAREKCAMSVEQLALLACLSKKQIQQIENGQSSSFYSSTIKLVAAKKVAKLIQLDEKDAFDFGSQAELPFTQTGELTHDESSVVKPQPLLDEVKVAEQIDVPKPALPEHAAEVMQATEEESAEAKKATGRKRKSGLASPTSNQPNAKSVLVEPKPELNKRVLFAAHEKNKPVKNGFGYCRWVHWSWHWCSFNPY